MAQGVPAGLTREQGRKFGLTLAPAFLALAGLLLWRGHEPFAWGAAAIGVLLGTGALVAPERLGPIERAWMAFAHALSKVTTPIILGIVWYVVLTPIGLLRRLFGGNPLAHRDVEGGYWVRRGEHGEQSDLKRQF